MELNPRVEWTAEEIQGHAHWSQTWEPAIWSLMSLRPSRPMILMAVTRQETTICLRGQLCTVAARLACSTQDKPSTDAWSSLHLRHVQSSQIGLFTHRWSHLLWSGDPSSRRLSPTYSRHEGRTLYSPGPEIIYAYIISGHASWWIKMFFRPIVYPRLPP